MTTSSICVVVPVLNRPHRVKPLVESFTASNPQNAKLLFIVERDDEQQCEAIREDGGIAFSFSVWNCRKWSEKINHAHLHLRVGWFLETDWYLLGADDLHFHPGWDTAPAELMADETIGVIGTNDLGNPLTIDGTHSTHPFVRRSYVDRFGIEEARGIVVPECYNHNYPDTELVAIAKKRSAYAHCKESVIEHLHPLHGKAPDDGTYELGRRGFAEDRKLFFARASIYKWPLVGHTDSVSSGKGGEAGKAAPIASRADRLRGARGKR